MKVLMVNRNPDEWVGGDMVQLNNTKASLEKLRVEVDFTCNGEVGLESYDLVHIFHINFPFIERIYERCIAQQKPYVISAIFFKGLYGVTISKMKEYAEKARIVICLSEVEKREMIDMLGITGENIVIIPNGVDKSIFKPMPLDKKKQVVSVGRLEPMKGPHLVIQACLNLGLPLCYVGAGTGVLADAMKEYIADYHEKVTQQELAKLYSQSSVYVCSSLTERQSLGVLEAAACGLPIVDSIHNRGHGLLPSSVVVNPENIEELSTAITEQIGKTNTDSIPSWDDVAGQILQVYQRI